MYLNAIIGRLTALATVLVAIMSSHTIAQSYKQQKDGPVGVWDLKGLDSANTEWIATVVLTQAMDGALGGCVALTGWETTVTPDVSTLPLHSTGRHDF